MRVRINRLYVLPSKVSRGKDCQHGYDRSTSVSISVYYCSSIISWPKPLESWTVVSDSLYVCRGLVHICFTWIMLLHSRTVQSAPHAYLVWAIATIIQLLSHETSYL